MTHLTTATVCSGDFKQCAVFFYYLILLHWLQTLPGVFLRFPERHPEARTVHIRTIIDLQMFDIEVNRTQVVDAVPVSAILKQTKQGRYQVLILSL